MYPPLNLGPVANRPYRYQPNQMPSGPEAYGGGVASAMPSAGTLSDMAARAMSTAGQIGGQVRATAGNAMRTGALLGDRRAAIAGPARRVGASAASPLPADPRIAAIQSQTAAMAGLRQQLEQNPIENQINADPGRRAAIANQQNQIAAMQGIQQRMAESGNAQLGTAGRFSVADLSNLPSAPYGRSVAPGVVSRGGVTNFVGQLPSVAALNEGVEERAAAEAIRRAGVAQRVQANRAQQLAGNADTMQQWGRTPADNFTSGKQYVPGQGYQPISNFAAAQQGMNAEQAQSFDARRTARQADLDLRKQRQFSRAQFREAAAGRGAIYNDDGGLNLSGTIATQMAAANAPTSVSINPATGTRYATFGNQGRALDALIDSDRISEQGRQFDGRLGLDQQRLDAATDLNNKRFGLDERRFDFGSEMAGKQFGLQELQMGADNQFRQDELGFRQNQISAEDARFNKEFGLKENQFKSTDELARERLKMEQQRAVTQDTLAGKQMTLEELKAQEAVDQGKWSRSEEAYNRELHAKGIAEKGSVEESLMDTMKFASLPPAQQKPVINSAIAAVQASPSSAAEILKKTGIDVGTLTKELQSAGKNQNWLLPHSSAQEAERNGRINSIKALLEAAGSQGVVPTREFPALIEDRLPVRAARGWLSLHGY
jgi:hypothetical protein